MIFCLGLFVGWIEWGHRFSLKNKFTINTLNGSQVFVVLGDGSLELAVLSIKLIDVLFVLFLFLLLSEGGIIEGINDGTSEFVQHANDFSEGFLISEVLLWGKGDEGLDEGSLLAVGLDLVLNLLQSSVEFLDLEEGWVIQVGQKGESIINSLSGSIHFAYVSFEFLVLLSSDEGGLIKVLSVLLLVVLESGDLLSKLLSSGLQKVLNAVISSSDVDFSILDILLEGDNKWVVLVGSNSEVKVKID